MLCVRYFPSTYNEAANTDFIKLGIMQDEKDDKAYQIQKMDMVYLGAALTIVVSYIPYSITWLASSS